MRYGLIKWNDIADGEGVRVALFVSGCRRHCVGCHNQEAQDFSFGEEFTEEVRNSILEGMAPRWIRGLSILGGEPLEPENQIEVLELIKEVRRVYGRTKDIWLYTGGIIEDLWRENKFSTREIIASVDVLVDGPFILAERDPGLAFRGSKNQRIIYPGELLRGEKSWNR